MNGSQSHLSDSQIDDWLHSRLDVSELRRLSNHAFDCQKCRQRIEEQTRDMAVSHSVKSLPIPVQAGHLPDDEIIAYISGALSRDAADKAERHLKGCASCQKQTEALREFKNTMGNYMAHKFEPALHMGWANRFSHVLATFLRPAIMVPLLAGATGVIVLLVGAPGNTRPDSSGLADAHPSVAAPPDKETAAATTSPSPSTQTGDSVADSDQAIASAGPGMSIFRTRERPKHLPTTTHATDHSLKNSGVADASSSPALSTPPPHLGLRNARSTDSPMPFPMVEPNGVSSLTNPENWPSSERILVGGAARHVTFWVYFWKFLRASAAITLLWSIGEWILKDAGAGQPAWIKIGQRAGVGFLVLAVCLFIFLLIIR